MTARAAVAAELVSVLGSWLYLAAWTIMMQHFVMVLEGHPERSWINRAIAYWKSEKVAKERAKLVSRWSAPSAVEEPRVVRRTKGHAAEAE